MSYLNSFIYFKERIFIKHEKKIFISSKSCLQKGGIKFKEGLDFFSEKDIMCFTKELSYKCLVFTTYFNAMNHVAKIFMNIFNVFRSLQTFFKLKKIIQII